MKDEFKIGAAAIQDGEKIYEEGVENYRKGKKTLAAFFFLLALSAGVGKAGLHLGVMCINGDGVQKNIDSGIKYLEEAAEKGEPEAFYNLGCAYFDDRNVKKDDEKALSYFQEAARLDVHEAFFEIGSLYFSQGKLEDAAKYFMRAADRGIKEAADVLASSHFALRNDGRDMGELLIMIDGYLRAHYSSEQSRMVPPDENPQPLLH